MRANPFAPCDRLSHAQFPQRFLGQMSIQREKFLALSGTVPQNHHRAVIFLRGVVRQSVNDAFQRRVDRAAGRHEKIDAQMNRAALVGRIASPHRKAANRRAAVARCIARPHADCEPFATPPKIFSLNASVFAAAGSAPRNVLPTLRSKTRPGAPAQIHIQQRSRRACMRRKPFPHRPALWHRRQSASFAKRVVREPRMNLRQPRQRLPRGRFGNGHVGIVRLHAWRAAPN